MAPSTPIASPRGNDSLDSVHSSEVLQNMTPLEEQHRLCRECFEQLGLALLGISVETLPGSHHLGAVFSSNRSCAREFSSQCGQLLTHTLLARLQRQPLRHAPLRARTCTRAKSMPFFILFQFCPVFILTGLRHMPGLEQLAGVRTRRINAHPVRAHLSCPLPSGIETMSHLARHCDTPPSSLTNLGRSVALHSTTTARSVDRSCRPGSHLW